MEKPQALAAAPLLVLVASLSATKDVHGICGLSNDEFKLCQPASECCAALGKANLSCICRYKGVAGIWLRMYHYIDAMPSKCGLAMPSNCS